MSIFQRWSKLLLRVCHHPLVANQIFDDNGSLCVIAMLIMRIYALYGRDLRVLVFLVVISAILFALGCVSVLFEFAFTCLRI